MAELTHVDADGRVAMVDVGGKAVTRRSATAEATVLMQAETLASILAATVKKGDVIATARLAGIMAAKRTSELIPLCHPLPLTSIAVDIVPDAARSALVITASCACNDRTGVEMEALTAVSIAALTVYDMCKAADRGMRITDLHLLAKSGGASGDYRADGFTAAVETHAAPLKDTP